MRKIYSDADNKDVEAVVVYANASGKLFYTETLTGAGAIPVPAEDCLNLFLNRVIAVKSGVYYTAKSCTSAGVIDFGFPTGT